MALGVFIHRSNSIYDDSPAERYQFPRSYLSRAQACVGDWIIYYEPRRAMAARGYFAIAKVERVIPDSALPNMFVAVITPNSYLDFIHSVPFSSIDGTPNERGLLNEHGEMSGRKQAAVRPISRTDFNNIVNIGLQESDPSLPRTGTVTPAVQLREEQAAYQFETARDRVHQLGSRIVRDRVFRQLVLNAYDSRCVMTGLKIINGGGRAEVEAAHIRPVEANGPDVISNGLALSGTVHWMFDRGLLAIEDDLRILVSRQVNDAASVRAMLNLSGFALSPHLAANRPHPHFLRWHRENRFKY